MNTQLIVDPAHACTLVIMFNVKHGRSTEEGQKQDACTCTCLMLHSKALEPFAQKCQGTCATPIKYTHSQPITRAWSNALVKALPCGKIVIALRAVTVP